MRDMTRQQQALLYTYGLIQDLIELGLLNGIPPLTDEGLKEFNELQASGFVLTELELRSIVQAIMRKRETP